MDIPSFIFTYGGPSGFLGIVLFLFLLDRKHSSERRAEVKKDRERVVKDLEREQEDNDRLRSILAQTREERDKERAKRLKAEEELFRCRRGQIIIRGEVLS